MSIRETTPSGNQFGYRFCTKEKTTTQQLQKFHCGNEYIDSYLKGEVKPDRTTTTYYWLDVGKNAIMAIAAIACSGIIINTGGCYNVLPAIEIKFFAVDREYQDLQWGEKIDDGVLSDYILCSLEYEIISDIAENVCGADYILLYSVPESLSFYKRNNYNEFLDCFLKSTDITTQNCIPLFKKIS